MEYNWLEIQEYRKQEIKAAAALMFDVFKDSRSPEFFKGVLSMFRAIMILPKSMCSEEELEYIESMVAQEFSQVSLDLLRKAVQ